MVFNQAEDILFQINESIKIKQKLLKDPQFLRTILEAIKTCTEAYNTGNKLIFAGNGGSAGDAQHLAAELVGRFQTNRPPLAAIALTTDSSIITCIANDYNYELVFERQLQANGKRGDVFFGISTSGKSKNILRAFNMAKSLGIKTIALTGAGDIQEYCDICIKVPSEKTARIQECHILIGQIICSQIENMIFVKDS